MRRKERGFIGKAVLWLVALAIVAVGAVFGINATDEELNEAAKKAMAMPPPPAPSPQNGYLDQEELAKVKVAQSSRLTCGTEPGRCLRVAAENPDLVKLNDTNDAYMTRYRAMRAKPEFVDLHVPVGPEDAIPVLADVLHGQGRALLHAANLANGGKLEAAVAELEAENAFHRRAAAGARSLIMRMIAIALLQRDAFFASELARVFGPQAQALLPRLKAIVSPLAPAEIDVRRSLEIERAQLASWMQTRRYAWPGESAYEAMKSIGQEMPRPWWTPIAAYLYRPHQSVNCYVAQTDILNAVADAPASQYQAAAEDATEKARALAPRGFARRFINPAGNEHPYLSISSGERGGTEYIGRAHVAQALYTMVRLQIALREAGLTNRAAIERAADGPLFQAHLDPFTGKPMRFDGYNRTVGFASPITEGPLYTPLYKLYGRIAAEVTIDF